MSGATRRVLLRALVWWPAGAALAQAPSAPPPLELNDASQAELEQLPGVGPALSEALLDERRRGGPFTDWRALVRRVRGVGPASARRLSAAGLRVAGQAWTD